MNKNYFMGLPTMNHQEESEIDDYSKFATYEFRI
jgi:hypothetical protein